ncbi:MAG: metal-dependent transcriptional regulator [Candidatus Bathycorpusculaceae bacterium]
MSHNEEITVVTEEYLECIYRLEEKRGAARTNDIVKMLNVVPGTVTNTVERLEKDGFLTHSPYKGVKLTEKGRKIALQVIRRHRLSERLLVDILHMKWEKVHDAACKLEHGITEEITKPLEKALKHPKTCPHGNPIPTACGGIIEERTMPLTNLAIGKKGVIVKITEEQIALLQYLGKLGLVPGTSVEILEKAPLDGPITVKIGSSSHALSRAITSVIQVKQAK